MIEVELPTGEVISFPDEMPLEQVKKRAGLTKDFVEMNGRMPERVTDSSAMMGEPRQKRTIEAVAREGLALARQVRGGELDPKKLTDAEILAIQIATRQVKPGDLSAEDKHDLGLPRGRFEELRRGYEGGKTSTLLSDVGRGARRGVEAGKAAFTRPVEELPIAGSAFRLSGQARRDKEGTDPEWLRVLRRIPYEALGGVERVMNAPFAAGVAALHEDPKQQEILGTLGGMAMMRAAPGVSPVSTMSKRALAARQISDLSLRPGDPMELRPELVPPPGVESLPSERGVRMRRSMQPPTATGQAPDAPALREQRALPPAGGSGFEILENARQTRRQLGGRVGDPLALPEAPREASVRPREAEPLTVSSGGPQREPGLVEPRPPEPPLPTSAEIAGRRAGLWPKTVEPSEILDPQGRPVMREPSVGPSGFEILEQAKTQSVPRFTSPPTVTGEVTPPGPRLAPPTEITPMGEQGIIGGTPARSIPTGKLRTGAPQVGITDSPLFAKPGPQQGELTPPPVAGAGLGPQYATGARGSGLTPPPIPTGRSTTRRMPKDPTSTENVNLGDPDSLVTWIRGEGGLKATTEAKGINVPFLRKKNGLAMDELAQMYADARGGTAKAAEDAMTKTLQRYQSLREAKRKGQGPSSQPYEGIPEGGMQHEKGFQVRPEANEAEVPLRYEKTLRPEEWNSMSPAERTEMMNFFDSMGRSNPELMTKLAGLGLGAAASPLILQGLRGQPQDQQGGQHPLIGRLMQTVQDIKGKLAAPPTSPLLTPEADRSSRRRLEERFGELGRLAVAAAPFAAGMMAGGRGARGAGGEPIAALRGGRLVPPPVSAWSESTLPLSPKGPPGPPGPPKMPGTEPSHLGPFQGVPGIVASGSALRGLRDLTRQGFSTILGRMEQFGPAGQEISRLMQRVAGDTEMFYGRNITPLIQEMHGLSSVEKANFVEVAEGKAQPMNERVQGVHENIYLPIFGPAGLIPKEATRRGILTKAFGEAKPFQPREQFFPHEFDPAFVREILRPRSAARERAVAQLMERESVDDVTANTMIDDYFRATVTRQGNRIVYLEPDRFVGGLERARELNIDGYITDPEIALGLRLWKVARRFAEIDHYGYQDAVIGESSRVMGRPALGPTKPTGLVGQIQDQMGSADATKAYQLFKYVVGHPVEEQSMQALARTVTTVEAFTKLPLAFVANATQPTLTALRTSLGATARGLMDIVLHPRTSIEEARTLGTISDMSIRELYQEMRGGYPNKLVDFALKPFNIAEKWNRIVSANTGKAWAHDLDTWLHRGQREGFVRRELERLSFGREEIEEIVGNHSLRKGDGERIAWGVVDQTQFLGAGARRSEAFYAHPFFQIAMQFKSFSMNTGRLMHQMLTTELVKGDPRFLVNTLATMGVLFPLVGELALDARAFLRGRSRDTDLDHPAARVLENFMAVAGFGLATDFIDSLVKGGQDAALSFLAGPAISDAGRLSKHAVMMATSLGGDEGEFAKRAHDATRFLARQVPFVGPRLSEYLRQDRTAAAEAEKTWQERLGLDPMASRVKAIEAEDRRRKATQSRANQAAAEGRMDEARTIIEEWNALHEAKAGLSPTAIESRQRRTTQTPEQKRLGRLSAPARARVLREIMEGR